MGHQAFSQEQKLRRRWLLACGLGIPVGLAIGQVISFEMGYLTGDSKIWAIGFFSIGPGLAGMVVGIAQWLVLKGDILPDHRWVVATTISWAVGHAVTVWVGNRVYGVVNLALWQTVNLGVHLAVVWGISGTIGGAIGGAIGGILVGLAQRWALQGKGFEIQRWILVTSLSWAIGHAVLGIVDFTAIGTMGLALSWVIYGIVYGTITSQSIGVFHRSKH